MRQILDNIQIFTGKYLNWISMPTIMWTDIIEILIITFLVYQLLVWVKDTKAWSLMKGIVVILVFVFVAAIFDMTTILWIAKNVTSIAVTALLVVFQPELRKALEQLGKKSVITSLFSFDNTRVSGELFSDTTIDEIVRAAYEMGKAKTGALIVIEQNDSLVDYEKTGILVDAVVSSQLLINIFEHNTPLHDGAVIIRENRVVSATCYLPLSESMELSKELGTRHRAGIGISEVTDSLTVIVSEETGRVSATFNGELFRNIDADFLKAKLTKVQNKTIEEKKLFFWKGRSKNEKVTDK